MAGTATRCSPERRALGAGMESTRLIRPAMASSRASAASARASVSSAPEVQALGEVAERDDELAGGVGAKARRIGESHGGLPWGSSEIISIEPELTNHGRQEAGFEVLARVSDDGRSP